VVFARLTDHRELSFILKFFLKCKNHDITAQAGQPQNILFYYKLFLAEGNNKYRPCYAVVPYSIFVYIKLLLGYIISLT
jgi:hypothetical protein